MTSVQLRINGSDQRHTIDQKPRIQDVFDLVGQTPSVRIRIDPALSAQKIFVKLEGMNPSGSLKDRAGVAMLRTAIEEGHLTPGKTILDASSGNFACAVALYAKILGYPCEFAVSSKLTAAKRDFLAYLGATLYTVGDFTIQGNHFCRELSEKHSDKYFFMDQLHNSQNPGAHYRSTGPEILAAFPDLAMVVASLGSGGTLAGVAQYMKKFAPHVRIVAVECASGNRLPGTGSFLDGDYVTPFIRKGYEEQLFDEKVLITEAEAARATRWLVNQGIFGGLQTGGVVHACVNRASALNVKGSIVAISGDTGWKNLDKLIPAGDKLK